MKVSKFKKILITIIFLFFLEALSDTLQPEKDLLKQDVTINNVASINQPTQIQLPYQPQQPHQNNNAIITEQKKEEDKLLHTVDWTSIGVTITIVGGISGILLTPLIPLASSLASRDTKDDMLRKSPYLTEFKDSINSRLEDIEAESEELKEKEQKIKENLINIANDISQIKKDILEQNENINNIETSINEKNEKFINQIDNILRQILSLIEE